MKIIEMVEDAAVNEHTWVKRVCAQRIDRGFD